MLSYWVFKVLHISWVTVFYEMCLLQIFSPACGLTSQSLDIAFAEQKLLILMKSSLSIISFMDYVFGIISKKLSPSPRISRFSLMLWPKGFIDFNCAYLPWTTGPKFAYQAMTFQLLIKSCQLYTSFIFWFLPLLSIWPLPSSRSQDFSSRLLQ